ncbi:predicted protein [Postia placenta Mad-698-R]|nr:predicted protein [Postia placenta Mad-698-R]
MVLPFPNEIWLDIFHGLAKEGEYDALERCRVVCREFRPMAEECLLGNMSFISTEEVERIKVQVPGGEMRRWRGPLQVFIHGGHWDDGRQPIPHLAMFASRFAGKWLFVEMLGISRAVWRSRDLDADAVFRDLARFSITSLILYDVVFPTILTLGQLVCALPRLNQLILCDVGFTRPPFDASTISQFRLLPRTQLETLSLGETSNTPEPSPPFVELVYPWSAVRTLTLLGVGFPSVTTFARLLCALPALENLVFREPCTFTKHEFDLQSIPAHPGLPSGLVAVEFQSNRRSDPLSMDDLVDFFITTGTSSQLGDITFCPSRSLRVTTESDISLNRLSPPMGTSPSPKSRRCVATFRPEFRISVQFYHAEFHDVKVGMLIEKLPQLDAILSRPFFEDLAHINVDIYTTDGLDIQDEQRANELRVCLAKLDERGILGILVNSTSLSSIGLRWDYKTESWKHYGVERGAAQEDVKNSAVIGVDDESCTNDADSRVIACSDSGAVLAAFQIGSPSSADAQTRFSSLSSNARVATELASDGGIPQQDATAGSDTYLSPAAPEAQATGAESSVGAGQSEKD